MYLLAEDGIYEFSKAKMAYGLAMKFPTHAHLALLASLRVLNMRFFAGNTQGHTISPESSKAWYIAAFAALGAILGKRLESTECSYRDAVAEFVATCSTETRRLGYRLRIWFLLLVYDGINLFCEREGIEHLNSFNEARLADIAESDIPVAIRRAAFEALDYHRNYPLKYFLLEQSKVPVTQACKTLVELASSLGK